jgi:hypothetical protein
MPGEVELNGNARYSGNRNMEIRVIASNWMYQQQMLVRWVE